MDARTFRAFVKTARALQADDDTPGDYVMVKAAVAAKFGLLKMADNPYLELAGLSTLALPAVQELRHKPMSERGKAIAEVGGLGMLAAPYAHRIGKQLLKR